MNYNNKKIILYGENKLKNDFEYIFNNLKIDKCLNIINYKEILTYNLNDIVILICTENFEQVIKDFENMDLIYKKHFFLARDFFCMMTFFYDKEVAIWGTGHASDILVNDMDFDFEFYIDNDISKNNNIINGKVVKHSSSIKNWENKFIIIASTYYEEIKLDLINLGLTEIKDFIDYKLIMQFLEMFDKLIKAKQIRKLMCNYPFYACHLYTTGDAYICCYTEKYPIGNIKNQDIKDIWSSIYAKMIRCSIINKTFCYCDPRCHLKVLDYMNVTKEEEYPIHVNVQIDDTCNLMCPQCRKSRKIAKGLERQEVELLADKIITDVVPHVQHLLLAGAGEVFYSPSYRRILKSKEIKNVDTLFILSNGILFNEQNWQIVRNLNINHITLYFSIDAATKETYEKLRKGGKFDILMKNLNFAKQLKASKEVETIRLFFVVQRDNYKEMISFINLGKQINADSVTFSRIHNWVGYSDEEFKDISMYDEKGNPKPELEEILLNPVFKDPIVKSGLDVIG